MLKSGVAMCPITSSSHLNSKAGLILRHCIQTYRYLSRLVYLELFLNYKIAIS